MRGRSVTVQPDYDSLCSLLLTISAEIDSPAHLVTDQVTQDTATISWDRVQAVIDRYMMNYTSVDGDTEEMEVGKNRTTMTLTGLKPGIEHVIYLWAEKGAQQSKRTSTEAVTGIPGESLLFCMTLLRK